MWNAYLQTGALGTALLLVAAGVAPLELRWQGFVAGAILVTAFTCTLLAVDRLGVARAEPLWCGAATATSWALGKGLFAEGSSNWPLSLFGLLLAVTAMGGLARSAMRPAEEPQKSADPVPLRTLERGAGASSTPLLPGTPTAEATAYGQTSRAEGVQLPFAAGAVGGCQVRCRALQPTSCSPVLCPCDL